MTALPNEKYRAGNRSWLKYAL